MYALSPETAKTFPVCRPINHILHIWFHHASVLLTFSDRKSTFYSALSRTLTFSYQAITNLHSYVVVRSKRVLR